MNADEFYGKAAARVETLAGEAPIGERAEETIAPPPDEDAADRLYGDPAAVATSYAPLLADALNRLRDETGMTQEQYDAAVVEAAVVFSDARIEPALASRLYDHVVRHVASPADDATVEAWAVEARRALRERYGAEDADERVRIARRFIANRPALERLLNETGLGSHPDVVLALAENPRAMRLTPRASAKRGG